MLMHTVMHWKLNRPCGAFLTFGGLKGYSGVNVMSRKKTPPSYTEPGGPKIVDLHS